MNARSVRSLAATTWAVRSMPCSNSVEPIHEACGPLPRDLSDSPLLNRETDYCFWCHEYRKVTKHV